MDSCIRIKDGKGRLMVEGNDELLRGWKDYFLDLYNIDIEIRF